MAIVRQPTPCNLADLYIMDGASPATATSTDAGLTSDPEHFVVPAWQINPTRTAEAHGAAVRQSYYAKVGVLQPGIAPRGASAEQYNAPLMVTRHANEGNNRSIYLAEGVYETNSTINLKLYKQSGGRIGSWFEPCDKPTQPRVYLVMPHDIADLNRQAETEHCADFLRAYELTLGALEDALAQAAAAPLPSSASADLARTARLNQLQHFLPAGLAGVAQKPDLCAQKYKELIEKSRLRDQPRDDSGGWHDFGLEFLDGDFQPKDVHYLTGNPRPENGRIYLRYTRGDTQIGTHTSASIIKF